MKMTIGKLAKQCGVGVETIRFYEREGLILQPKRKPSGYRLYPKEAVNQIYFIRQAKDLGFTLKEIREILNLRLDGEQACDEVRSLAEVKIANIEEKIDLLQRMRTTLGELVVACKSNKRTEPCPILRAIEKEDRL
ncbi:MAG: heavy metal-responsive transcriptional regulator [Mariprofundaceae bacterium]|nr:heavy metal-responsive transcriptional regulator [Mariprofundaceae bacterium]